MDTLEIKDNKTVNLVAVATEELSGSEILLKGLIAEGVDTIFGYPGGAIMPIYDAIYDYKDELNHVLVRHEQGATHAAQGYARSSGRVGVVFATSGPGATNLITGIADAQIDSTPMVCITGQVFAHLLGTDAFQETDVINITTPITKWNYQVTDASEIAEVLAKAFYIAKSGRPGPVLIDITKNAQIQKVAFKGYQSCRHIRSYRPYPIVRNSYIEQAAELINSAKKPFVLFGQGVLLGNAEKEFKAFVEKAGIPSAWTIMGVGAIPTDHPLNVGMLGMHGNYGPNVLTNECDVLIAVGMRFDDRVTGRLDKYAKQAKVIHLDIDPSEIDKNVINNIIVKLEQLGAPKGSIMNIEKTHEKINFGKLEGIGIYIDGVNLSKNVYEECDINFVITEIHRLIQTDYIINRYLIEIITTHDNNNSLIPLRCIR